MNSYNIKKKLNIFKVSLNGINLIEASAGTGKTFTIVLLYLRLLLGIGKKNTRIKKLLVHEILVVTFTNAAKEELYIRIKNGIENLCLTCINKVSKYPIFNLFLNEIHDINEAIFILKKAQNDLNNIAVYTIHGFCQKILTCYTFHLNSIFKDRIITNEDNLYLQATQDFWRRYFYDLPENIINIIYQDYNSPEYLLKTIKPLLHIPLLNLKKESFKNETLIVRHKKNIQEINDFKKIWLIYSSAISKTINNLKINKRIYNKFNISRWIDKITTWAKSNTQDYTIPESLKYFSKKKIEESIINNIFLPHILFIETEKILKKNFSLKDIVIFYAIKNIPKFLKKEKTKQSLLGFNDLLNIVLKTIKKEKFLKNLINKKYPAAFIDEFQDTDMQQYEIFNIIYQKNKKTVLFFIGDPKQAIYSFRGADIFSYLYAKSKIKKQYYLNTNWRSSKNMCQSINLLFSQHNNPFLFKNISFTPVISSCKNIKMDFKIKEVSQAPLRFFLQEKKIVSIDDYRIWISKQCSNEISYWLNHAKIGKAKIFTKNGERILQNNDIAILVRNQKEASLIQNELQKKNIASTYSSYKNSVFHTFDAQELLWILESILEPTNKQLLQQSLSTCILKKISSKIQKQSRNENLYYIIEKLYEYHSIWNKIGIFNMIKNIILEYQKNLNSTEIKKEYQKNLNFLHLAELLEEEFQYFYKKESLVYWLKKRITEKKETLYNEHVRHFNESESVQIITIHKSKGLEYPIVWIPFSIDFNQSKLSIYHNKKSFKTFFDTTQSNQSFKKANEERLAEDLRFLYVALTRSILHCSIGIACLIKKKIKNNIHSHVHQSSLEYIIQPEKSMNYENLHHSLNKLSINNFIEVKNQTDNFILPIQKKTIYLIPEPCFLKKNIKNIWNLTSFTKLNQEHKFLIHNKNKTILEYSSTKTKKRKNFTTYNFPTGQKTGLLMHDILKNLHFLNKKNDQWFCDILEKYEIPLKWSSTLISWVENIINTPLNPQNITLSKLQKQLCIKELEFFLPIKKILYSTKLNHIMQSLDSISTLSPELFFNPVKGILKGFIDLIFFWNNKYYIVDYKSNWLGKNNNFYSEKYIKQEMIKHRYDFQYQIYTVALHKYLQKKIKNYNYNNDFGGVFYIFLRAIGKKIKNNGIFYTLPNYSLIEKMTILIS